MNRKSSIVTLYCITLIHWSVFPIVADDPEPSEKIMEIISKQKTIQPKLLVIKADRNRERKRSDT